jgi:fatty-acyl-CoA synthase
MFGLMQDRPLMISSLIEHAAAFHPRTEIVTRTIEGPTHRTNYAEIRRRSKQVANALKEIGVEHGDRVGTLASNTYRHLELYFGVSGSGAVLHTVNPRLFPEQITYIVNHAEDKVLFFDITFAPLVAKLAPSLNSVTTYVAMTDRAHMPDIDLPNLLCYEELIGSQSDQLEWPEFDERTASSLCYTSGTTGNPKGVLYSHRSTILHTLMAASGDAFAIGAGACLLLIVPMFHANAWGMPYVVAATGAKLVLPGQSVDGETIREEGVTFSQAVPTVWLMLFQYLDRHPEIDFRSSGLKRVGIGGSAPPRSMLERFESTYGIETSQGWGMTETSPIGVISTLLPKHRGLPLDQILDQKRKQGRGVWGVEIKLLDDNGSEVPRDGKTSGHIVIRGPWIASGYFKGEGGKLLREDGFFPTGDIGTIDEDGYLQLVDRAKDVIKSGGEWISSIDLENAAMAHPAVAEAAVIGIAHPTWQERPLLLIVKRGGADVTREALLEFLAGKVVKWWLPDDVVFVDELPRTATGKLSKLTLRQQFAGYKLPTA